MNTQKRRVKRGLAGFLAFCLMITSINTAAFAAADVPTPDAGRLVQLHLDGQQLKEAAQAAIAEGAGDDSQKITPESLGLTGEITDASMKTYQRLFAENGEGALYEISPEYADSDVMPSDAGMRVFVRVNATDGYLLNEKEDLIFLFSNGSEGNLTFRVNVDENIIQDVLVKAHVEDVADEELPAESEAATEETTVPEETETAAPAGDETEATAPVETEETTEAEVTTEAAEETAEVETEADIIIEETEAEVAEETEGAESEVSISALRIPLVASSIDDEDEDYDDAGEIFLIDDVNGTTEENTTETETKLTRKSLKIKGDLADTQVWVESEGATVRAFVTSFEKVLKEEWVTEKATGSNVSKATGSNATLVVKHAYPGERGYEYVEDIITDINVGSELVASDYVAKNESYVYTKTEPETLAFAPGKNELTIYYEWNQEYLASMKPSVLPIRGSRARSVTIPEGTVAAKKTAQWKDGSKTDAEITLTIQGQPTKPPIDVVVVLDASTSMNNSVNGTTRHIQTVNAATEFINRVFADNASIVAPENKNRIGITSFAKGKWYSTSGLGSSWDEQIEGENAWNISSSISSAISDYQKVRPSGSDDGTNYNAGLSSAYDMLVKHADNISPKRDKYVLILSDGEPNAGDGTKYADDLKAAGVSIFAIGINLGAKDSEALTNVCSDPATMYRDVQDPRELSDVFLQIAGEMQPAGKNAVLRDVINGKLFELVDVEKLPAQVTWKKLADGNYEILWNVGVITEKQKKLVIPIRLIPATNEELRPGTIFPNDNIYLTYTDINGQEQNRDKNELGHPALSLGAGTITINYYRANSEGQYILEDGTVLTDPNSPFKELIMTEQFADEEGGELGYNRPYKVKASTPVRDKDGVEYALPSGTQNEKTVTLTTDKANQTVDFPVYLNANYPYEINYYKDSISPENELGEIISGSGKKDFDFMADVDTNKYHPGNDYIATPQVNLNGGTGKITGIASQDKVDIIYLKKGSLSFEEISKTQTYNGNPLTVTGTEIATKATGLKEGDTVVVKIKGEDSFSIVNVKDSTTLGGADVTVQVMRNGVDVTSEYQIAPPKVSLEITKATLTMDLEGKTVTYDVKEHTLTKVGVKEDMPSVTYTYAKGSVTSETPTDKNYTSKLPKHVNAGSYRIFVRAEAGDNFESCSGYADVIISKRKLTLKAGSAEKDFDGTALTNSTVIAEPGKNENEGLLPGHKGIATVTGSQTEAGSSSNVIDLDTLGVVSATSDNTVYTQNYELTGENGRLTVNKISAANAIQLFAPNLEQTYSGEAHTYQATASLTGTITGEELTIEYSLTGNEGTWSTDRPTFKNVSDSSNVFVRASNKNFEGFATAQGTATINAKAVTITVENASKLYGEADPAFTGTVDGVVDGESLADVVYKRADEDMDKNNVGDAITLTATYKENNNYSVTITTAKLTINKAGGNAIQATNTTKEYTGSAISYPVVEASQAGSTIEYSLTGEDGSWSTEVPTFTDVKVAADGKVSSYPVYVRATHSSYGDVVSVGSMTITPAPVTIKAEDKTMTYGETMPELTGTVEGLKKADDLSITYALDRELAGVGSYTINASHRENSNYTVSTTPGTLVVSAATLGLTVTGNEGVYNGTPYTLNKVMVTGVGGTEITDVIITYATGEATDTEPKTGYSSDMPKFTDAGNYKVFVKVQKANYEDAIGSGLVTISKRPLTLMAATTSKPFDGTPLTDNRVFAKTGENENEGLLPGHKGMATVTGSQTEAGSTDNVIDLKTLKVVSMTDDNTVYTHNYNLTGKNGTLTVNKISAANAIQLSAPNLEQTYSGEAHTYQATASLTGTITGAELTIEYSLTGNEGTWSTDRPTFKNVSDSSNVFVRASNKNFEGFATTQGTATINAKAVTITVENASKLYGTADPAFTGTVDGVVAGDSLDVVYKRADEDMDKNNVGDDITLTATHKENNNYSVTIKTAKLTINKAGGNAIQATNTTEEYTGSAISYPEVKASQAGSTIEYSLTGEDGSWSTEVPTFTDVKVAADGTVISYPVYVRATHSSYGDVVSEGSMTITPAPVTIKADDKTMTYGETMPGLTGTVEGLKKADDLTITYALDRELDGAGTYTINVSHSVNNNYTVRTTPGTLTVSAATLGLTVTGNEGVYNGTPYTLNEVTVTGVGGTEITDATITYATGEANQDAPNTPYGSKPSFVNAGTYKVYVKAIKANYEEVTGSALITIDQRRVLITAGSDEKVYDGLPLTNQTATASKITEPDDNTGLVLSHKIKAVRTEGSIVNAGNETNQVVAGSVVIASEGNEDETNNYTFDYALGTLTINQADPKDHIKLDGPNPSFTFTNNTHQYPGEEVTVSGQNNETLTVEYSIDGGKTWNTEAPEAFVNVVEGGYEVLIRAGSDNYDGHVEITRKVTIEPKKVTIDVTDSEKTFGHRDPDFSGTVNGVVEDDTTGIGTVSYVRHADSLGLENVTDIIIITANYTKNPNYDVTIEDGKLTILPSDQNTVSVVGSVGTYNGDSHTLTSVEVGDTAGSTVLFAMSEDAPEDEWTTEMPKFTDVNIVDGEVVPYKIYVKVVNENYATRTAEATILINRRPLIIKADDATAPFTNEALTKPTAQVVGELGLVEGDEFATLVVEGSQTQVGSSDNLVKNVTISRRKLRQVESELITDFYDIELRSGKLTIAPNPHNLTIAYAYQIGEEGDIAALPPKYESSLHFKDAFAIPTPAIAGYVANVKVVEGVMNLENINVTVTYEKDVNGNEIPDSKEDKYTITFLAGNRGQLEGTTTFGNILTGTKFGEAVVVPTPRANSGWRFDKWVEENDVTKGLPETDGIITANKTYVATWTSSGGGGGGTGGGGGGGNPGNPNTPSTPGGPGETTTITPEDVPLATLPPTVDDADAWIIDDGEVPLAALPKTGDSSAAMQLSLLLSSLMAGLYIAFGKKKKEEK